MMAILAQPINIAMGMVMIHEKTKRPTRCQLTARIPPGSQRQFKNKCGQCRLTMETDTDSRTRDAHGGRDGERELREDKNSNGRTHLHRGST